MGDMREGDLIENPQTPIVPIPETVAQDFVRDREGFGRDAKIVYAEDQKRIVRVFQREEEIPLVGRARLVLDYGKYDKGDAGIVDRLQFEYHQQDPDDSESERVIAQMHLERSNDEVFVLNHRHVLPEFRGKTGLGKHLYEHAENFVRRIASERGSDVAIDLHTGQRSVIEWAEKMGFSVIAEHQDVFDELRDHPERFVEDDVFVSPESRGQGIVKDRYTFPVGARGRYMENAIRLTMKKVIHPERKEIRPEVRLATVADAAEIARIHRESSVETYVNDRLGITRGDMLKYVGDADEARLRWENHLRAKDPTAHTTILKIGDRTVGFCRVRRGSNIGHVEMLYLDPAYSGKGIGGEIFQESLQWLGDDQPIELEVASYNDRAIRFYERFGFRRQGYARPTQVSGGGRIPLAVMVRDRQEE